MGTYANEPQAIAVTALCGGVGGAKVAAGLARLVRPELLTIVVNTGDDFRRYGLYVAPDVDTVLYTLSDLADSTTGWGLAGDSGRVMERLAEMVGALDDEPGHGTDDEPWFHLGDRDLATHLLRTSWLASGATPTEVTRRLARALTVAPTVLPMTDSAACATSIATADGELPFQEWFVHRRCEPPAINVRYGREAGGVPAAPTDAVLSAIADADLVVVCPSNPYLSIWPILALDGMRESLAAGPAPVVAISPVIGGRAVKGPTARMLRDFAGEASSVAVARLYNDFLDGIVIDATDEGDAAAIEELGIAVAVTGTLMTDDDARARVARRALDLGADIARRSDGVGEA